MKQPRAGQAASVVRPPNWIIIDLDRHPERSRIAQHGATTRWSICQDFRRDPELLKPPKIRPFDPREDRKIREQLRKASITQRITAVLPAEHNAATERVACCSNSNDLTEIDLVLAARVDPNATVPIPVLT